MSEVVICCNTCEIFAEIFKKSTLVVKKTIIFSPSTSDILSLANSLNQNVSKTSNFFCANDWILDIAEKISFFYRGDKREQVPNNFFPNERKSEQFGKKTKTHFFCRKVLGKKKKNKHCNKRGKRCACPPRLLQTFSESFFENLFPNDARLVITSFLIYSRYWVAWLVAQKGEQ